MSSRSPRSRPAAAAGQPRVQGEADLGALAVGERDALRPQPCRERRRRGGALDVDEATLGSSRREPRAVAVAAERPRCVGQGVEHLVGEDDARSACRPLAPRSRSTPDRRRLEPRGDRRRAGAARSRPGRSAARLRERRVARPRGRPRMAKASVPVPAPYSRSTNGRGRSSRSQASTSPRASVAPKIGCVSGAVRKSPPRPGRAVGGPVVAAGRVVERELHEPGEGDRPGARRSRRGCGPPAPHPGRRPRGRERARGAGLESRPRRARRCRTPRAGRRADQRVAAEQDRDRRVAAPPPSARAATDRRPDRGGGRSEAKRSSAAASRASSAPRRWARRTRVSTIARVARAGPACSPSDAGPSRSSSAPSTDAGGRCRRDRPSRVLIPWPPARRAQASLLDEARTLRGGCGPRSQATVGRRGPAGHEQLRAPIGRDRPRRRDPPPLPGGGRSRAGRCDRRAGRARAAHRCRTPAASDGAGRRPRSRRPPSSQRGSALSPGRSGRSASTSAWATATTSAEYRLLARAHASVVARRPRRTRRGPNGVASGMAPEPRTISPAGRSARTRARRRAPNDRSSGGPETTATSVAPAATNAAPMPIGEVGPAGGHPARDGPGLGARLPGA